MTGVARTAWLRPSGFNSRRSTIVLTIRNVYDMKFKPYQSKKSLTLLSRRKIRKSYSRNPQSAEKFREVCRILQAVPGYKLHPSGLVIESVGDLSVLSQESFGLLMNCMERDFSLETPETKFSEPYLVALFFVMTEYSRQQRCEVIAKSLELGFQNNKFCIHIEID